MKQLTKEEAIEFYESGKWKEMSPEELFEFQIQQRYLAVPFDKFHEAAEKALGRSVWTHEFASPKNLLEEYRTGESSFEKNLEVFAKKHKTKKGE